MEPMNFKFIKRLFLIMSIILFLTAVILLVNFLSGTK